MNQLYEKYKDYSQVELDDELQDACRIGDTYVVQFLLTNPELPLHANISSNKYGSFINACGHKSLELVKYLLTSPDLQLHADIHAKDDAALHWGAILGNLPLIKYLLTSPELKEHANINANESACFKYACRERHTEIMKYLLASPDLKEHTNLENAFHSVCDYQNMEMAQYLIFELNIPKTKRTKKILRDIPSEEIENMFKIRELNNKLSEELLLDKQTSKKTIKI